VELERKGGRSGTVLSAKGTETGGFVRGTCEERMYEHVRISDV